MLPTITAAVSVYVAMSSREADVCHRRDRHATPA